MDLERLLPVRQTINSVMDVVHVRRQGLEMALELGFPTPEATKIGKVHTESINTRFPSISAH